MAKTTTIKSIGNDRSGIEFTVRGFAPVHGGDPSAAARHFFSEMARKLGPGSRYEWVLIDREAHNAAYAAGITWGHAYYKSILVAGDVRTPARIDMSFIDISDESRLLPDTAKSKPPSERLRARELARPPAGGGLRSTQQPARIRHMPRYVIKTINDDGTTGCEAFDGIAENEEAAKDRMAREYGHRDYAGLRDCSGFAGSNDRIVITQEPEPVYIDAGGYQFIIFDRGKLTECMMMWDTDAEAFRTPTHHVSAT